MITFSCEMIPWLVIIFGLVTAGSLNITDQQTSESSHHDQVAILKQIRKLNDDGSYTFGYEAGDGSFKVETRDVLGNVKGTFGFIDANGEIKRVTYSSSNGTGFKATTLSPLQERTSVIQSIPLKSNHSFVASQKKQNSMYFSTSESSSSLSSSLLTTSTTTPSPSSTKSNVIQSIPTRKSLIKTTPILNSTVRNTEKFTRAIFGQYFRNFSNRSRQSVNDHQPKQLSTPSEEIKVINHHKNDLQRSQISDSNSDVKADTEKDNLYARISLEDILHPINKVEDYNRRSEVNIDNNNFRRQIDQKPAIKVQESTEENSSNENFDVYNGRLLSTTRPLFTTTTAISPSTGRSKVIQRNRPETYRFHQVPKLDVLPLNEKNLGPAKFYNVETEKLSDESPEIISNHNYYDSLSNEKDEVADYIAKHPTQPVFSRHQYAEKNYKRLPLGIILTNIPSSTAIESQESNSEVLISRRIPLKTRIPMKHVNHQPLENKENIDFLTSHSVELPIASIPGVPATTNTNYVIEQRVNEFTTPRSESDVSSSINLQLIQQLYQHLQQQQNQYLQQQSMRGNDYFENYFYKNIVFPSEHQTPITLPLSRRDFQFILRRLLANQHEVYAYDHPTIVLNDALNKNNANFYHNLAPHYSSVHDQHSTGNMPVIIPRKYNQKIAASESNISKMTNLLNSPFQKISKSKYYDNSNFIDKFETINTDYDSILPPPIREALLLKLLQIAMDSKQQQRQILYKIPILNNRDTNMLSTLLSKVTAVPVYRKTGPIRSVQIISNDESDVHDNDNSST
ncbi:uncharacterized protein [Chelonus insularis]|uniref:uncharacterized protein n=1 Tax=Chelonus insularis TaxID=460826 RepID=UPI00158893D5|nr:uncharacterized protein LOC118070464 [Chelonus insularis]